MTDTDSRTIARDVLVRVEDGAYSHIVLPQMLRTSSLEARDRAFVTDLVYGTLRMQRRLDELLVPFGRRPLRRLDPPVRAALRMGAYQLVTGVPQHAAVGETVSVVPPRARGYVNAVLRALGSSGPPWAEPTSQAVALSYPDWIVERLTADLGADDAVAALEASNVNAAVSLRTRRSLTTAEALTEELRAAGAEVSPGTLAPDALRVRRTGDPRKLRSVLDGRATPQDESSQAVVAFVDAQRGDHVLDVAAAPGGKATGLAEQVGAEGLVVAADVNAGRLRLVRDAARRLGLTQLRTVVADGRHPPVRPRVFDQVLVDAPCSGLGVLRRRPDARWRIEEAAIAGLGALQEDLVLSAAPAVKVGGVLVYAVCTMTARETREVAERVVASLTDFDVIPGPGAPWRSWGPGSLILPHDAGTDGMFVVGLRRVR